MGLSLVGGIRDRWIGLLARGVGRPKTQRRAPARADKRNAIESGLVPGLKLKGSCPIRCDRRLRRLRRDIPPVQGLNGQNRVRRTGRELDDDSDRLVDMEAYHPEAPLYAVGGDLGRVGKIDSCCCPNIRLGRRRRRRIVGYDSDRRR